MFDLSPHIQLFHSTNDLSMKKNLNDIISVPQSNTLGTYKSFEARLKAERKSLPDTAIIAAGSNGRPIGHTHVQGLERSHENAHALSIQIIWQVFEEQPHFVCRSLTPLRTHRPVLGQHLVGLGGPDSLY